MNISELQKRSHAPYSSRRTAAVVESKSGDFFPGVRVENISFPLTISAIQNALFCCLGEGKQPQILYVDRQTDHPALPFWKNQWKLEVHALDSLNEISFKPVLLQVDDIKSTLKQLLDDAMVAESDFPVSALLETEHGFVSGVNIELNDWSKGLCAERVALAKALSYGQKDFEALHICTRSGEYSSPCGACRQVIIEHLPHQPVHLYHADGSTSTHYSSDLLPYNFQSVNFHKKSTDS